MVGCRNAPPCTLYEVQNARGRKNSTKSSAAPWFKQSYIISRLVSTRTYFVRKTNHEKHTTTTHEKRGGKNEHEHEPWSYENMSREKYV